MITAMPYAPSLAARWDELVDVSPHGTVLHARRFLDYHGDRFEEASFALIDDKERWVGVFPAARAPTDHSVVISHPGSTYGGLVPTASAGLPDTLDEMLAALRVALRERGVDEVHYKDVPSHVVDVPNQAIAHALWRDGAELVRRDLWNAFPLTVERKLSSNHRRSLKQARREGLTLARIDDDEGYAEFHGLLEANLAARYGTRPVHSLEELHDLRTRLGDAAQLYGVRGPDTPLLAASWVLRYGPRAWHTQYITSNPAGRDVGATVLLLEDLAQLAQAAGAAWFSLGASTEDAGHTVNQGLFRHKAGFGRGAVVADHYRWSLAT